MYEVSRKYRGLGKQRREELADALEQELAAAISETAGLHGYAVSDQGDAIETTTLFGDQHLAERARRRPPVHPDLEVEASVREVGRGGKEDPR